MQLTDSAIMPLKTGSHSQILLVERGSLQLVLKCVESIHQRQVAHLINQWKMLRELSHKNIVRVFKCLKNVQLPNREGTFYILAQQHAQCGTLSDLLKHNASQLTYLHRRALFHQVCQALLHLHCNDIVHRDIKLDNLLVCEGQNTLEVKMADFGFACTVDQTALVRSYKGTKRGFMAPQIHKARHDKDYLYNGKAADIFALGVVLYTLVIGRLPFEYALPNDRHYSLIANQQEEAFWNIQAQVLAKIELQQHAMVEQFKELFMGMVCSNPKERLTIQEVLGHPWMKGVKEEPQL